MTEKTFICLATKTGRDRYYGLVSIPDCSFTILPDMPKGFSAEYIGSYKTDAFFALFSLSDDRLEAFKKLVVYSTATDKWITRIDDADALVKAATGREDLVADFELNTHRFKLYTYYSEHRLGIPVQMPEGGSLLISLSTETWEVVEIAISPRYFNAARDDWFVYEDSVFLKTDIENPIATFPGAQELLGISDDGTTMVFDSRGNYPDWLHTFTVVNTNDWSYEAYETELSESGAYRPEPSAEMFYFLYENRIYNRYGKLVNTIGFEENRGARMHRDSDVVANITSSPTGLPSIVTLYNPSTGDIVSTCSIDGFYVQAVGSGPDIGGGGEVTAKNFWTGFSKAIEVI